MAAGCLYAATFILWYIYEGHSLFFPPDAQAYYTNINWMPLLMASWWDYACIGMFVIASGLALTAFRLRGRDF
ncbi:MAG TPA: hypothetical protein VEY11_09730 [Pyrinomonadaceae bacterium]|nr:hypothetical protein [Pyrinomonadaceae bacterium]